ncbi:MULTISPECIES: hypothetical protein [Bartonella]|uniref:hypothetical protein n=1 Tax=Bartonella TaxID=773 RepID=UPI002360A4CC|nr:MULTISPECIES: hypothetical protein [Bartonella]
MNSDRNLSIVIGGALNLWGKFKVKGKGDFTRGGVLSASSEQDFSSFDLDLNGKEKEFSKPLKLIDGKCFEGS